MLILLCWYKKSANSTFQGGFKKGS